MSKKTSGGDRFGAIWKRLLPWKKEFVPENLEELVQVLRRARSKHILNADTLAMMEGALHVSEMRVRDIIIPRSQMVVVERDAPPEAFLPKMIESAHSRFPVIGDNKDEVVGILLAKDVLHGQDQCERNERFNLRENLRPAVFIPESKRLNVLLKEFRSSRNHIAIVVDEYGGVAGMVTIEDVLEQIVGEIEDEHDFDEGMIFRHSPSHFTVKAVTPIEEFNDYFTTDLKGNNVETVGGLVTHSFGYLPKRGETVELEGFQFKILRADNRRTHLIQVNCLEKEAARHSVHVLPDEADE